MEKRLPFIINDETGIFEITHYTRKCNICFYQFWICVVSSSYSLVNRQKQWNGFNYVDEIKVGVTFDIFGKLLS